MTTEFGQRKARTLDEVRELMAGLDTPSAMVGPTADADLSLRPGEPHVWQRDWTDFSIAHTAEEAHRLYCEFFREPYDAAGAEAWEEVDDRQVIGVWLDANGDVTEIRKGALVRDAAIDWVRRFPQPRLLCSTEE